MSSRDARHVNRSLLSVKSKCTDALCKEKLTSSFAARAHARKSGHKVKETRVYELLTDFTPAES